MKEEVIIARKDGSKFRVVPIRDHSPQSPLDIEGIDTEISTAGILDVLRESREG